MTAQNWALEHDEKRLKTGTLWSTGLENPRWSTA
jgi:hypothetical protein